MRESGASGVTALARCECQGLSIFEAINSGWDRTGSKWPGRAIHPSS